MNQVDTNPLRALRIAGWAFVGLLVVDVLLCFRIMQLLHTPCTACCKSPLLLCRQLSDPVIQLHPRRLIRVSTASFPSRGNVGVVLFVCNYDVLIPSSFCQ